MNNEKMKVFWLFIVVAIFYIALFTLFYRIENHMEKVEKWMEQMDEKQAQITQPTTSSITPSL